MLHLRLATEADIETIRQLTFQVWPQTYAAILSKAQIDYMLQLMYSPEALHSQLQQGHEFVLLYDEKTVIGFASYSEVAPAVYKLQKLYLLPQQQGRGAGRFMIEAIISAIQPKGATALQLNVNRHNTAKVFYERLGFKVLRTEDIDIGSGYFMNDYVMELQLEPAGTQNH